VLDLTGIVVVSTLFWPGESVELKGDCFGLEELQSTMDIMATENTKLLAGKAKDKMFCECSLGVSVRLRLVA
jgi:hypothetical protein